MSDEAVSADFPSNGQRVLVVDDEKPILGLIDAFFASKGLPCETTSDPNEAIEMIEAEPIDVLVTDIHMKGLTGVDLLERAKEIDDETVVILMTGRPTVDTAVRSVRADAYDYVTKPFELEDLHAMVNRALEKRRLKRENTALKDTLALYRITQAVTASVDEHEVLEMVLETAERELEADRVVLYLVDEDGDLERWGDDGAESGEPWWKSRPIAARVYESGRTVVRPDDGDAHSLPGAGAPIEGRDGNTIGALVALRRDPNRLFDEGSCHVLLVLAGNAAAAIESAREARRAIESRAGLVAANAATVGALVAALDAREHETQTHSVRVTQYALRLAEEIDFPGEDIVHLKFGSMLHDIGKIGISDSILLKPDELTEEEWTEMRRHPMIGYQILRNIRFLEKASKIVLYHQERYDGEGYPFGLSGEDIPLGARLFAVVDTFDAMTNDRPYRDALTYDDVVDELTVENGKQFDPDLVDAFLGIPESDWARIRADVEGSSYNWEKLSMRGGFAGMKELA